MASRELRNLGVVAHVDAGKTTLTENMLFESGEIRSAGSVDKGTAHTDWLDVERERGISVRAATTAFKWKGTDINLIDTPGHVDFAAEVERSLRVLDCAILVVSAVEGVQAQSEILWKALSDMKIPTLIFVNKIDRIGAETGRVLDEIRRMLSADIVPIQAVIGEGTAAPVVTGFDELSAMKDLTSVYTSDAQEQQSHIEQKLDFKQLNTLRQQIIESIAERDEAMLERYINGEEISTADIKATLARLVQECRITPVLFGAALKNIGVRAVLDAVVDYLPAAKGDPEGEVSGVVFRLEHDSTMGRIAHVRLYGGTIRNRDAVLNVTQDSEQKVTQIRKVLGQKHVDAGILQAGDIAGVCGLGTARIGDILGSDYAVPKGYKLATPLLKVQAFPSQSAEYTQLVAALQELADEDPLLDLVWLKDERELHVNITGVIQLEVLTSLLKSRYNLDVTFGKPSVIYKETPSKAGEGFVAYTMPKPCWAVLRFLIEPGERGSGVVYSANVDNDIILPRYQRQVEKTIPSALKQGIHGWEVTDIKITLIYGEYHSVHTHPLDFIVATPMGIMDGLANTGTTLLEPILHFRISVPEEVGGKVLGDIINMRGSFDSPVIAKGTFTVEGTFPIATSMDYPVRIGSMSGGRGTISTRFAGYRECPLELGATTPYRGVNPLDRAKYILYVRSALGG